jgi:hypothetical protein
MKRSGLNFTFGEFQQVRHTEVFQRQKVPPRGLSEWVDRTREAKLSQLAGKLYPKIFEISHPELVSGSHKIGQNEMLNQVQHDNFSCFEISV